MTRTERDVTQTFVSLAGALVNGDDVVDLLTMLTSECVRLLDVESAGLLLADARGVLHVMAASSERTRELEVLQVQREDGPCRDCYLLGEPVSAPDLVREAARWPVFAPAAVAAGFASVHALPMRLAAVRLGTLGLFGSTAGALDDGDLSLGQGLADVASVALAQSRAVGERTAINEQLQTALNSRVLLEQAKGILAQKGDLDMATAFAALRRFARDHNRRLTDVAQSVVARTLRADEVLARGQSSATRRP